MQRNEENNRLGKSRDHFKRIRDTKGTFDAKMGTINIRNGKAITEQKILRRGGKSTWKNYIKMTLIIQITIMV